MSHNRFDIIQQKGRKLVQKTGSKNNINAKKSEAKRTAKKLKAIQTSIKVNCQFIITNINGT